MTGFVLLLHVVGWGVLTSRWPARLPARQHRRPGRRGRADGLHARRAARVRRRPHRLDRQHDPQARRRGPAVGHHRVLVLPRPLPVVFAASRCWSPGSARSPARPGRRHPGRPDARAVGTGVAGAFLVLIGLMNLVAAVGIARVFRRMRTASTTRRSSSDTCTTAASSPASWGGSPGGSASPGTLPGRPAHGAGVRHRDPGRAARARRGLGRLRRCPGTRSSSCRCSSPPG